MYKHDDKAAAATKDTKRTNSPAPEKKGLIDSHPKFACVAKKQPRVTSSSEESSVSMKRVRFRRIPQVIGGGSRLSSPRQTSSKRVHKRVQNIR